MAEVWTAQLHIAGGEASEDAPEIAYAERLDDAGRTARLYLLAEPDRPGSEQFIADLVTDVGEEFVAGSGSLTGLIQRAIRERHLDLLDWNRNSLPRDQASYGLSCLIQRGDEWFLAQIGPSLVYYREGQRLLRRRPSSERARAALGTSEVAAPEFSQLDLLPGEWALLINSNAGQALPDQVAAALRALGPEDVLPALYPHLRGMDRVSALVVAPTTDDPASSVPRPGGAAAPNDDSDEDAASLQDGVDEGTADVARPDPGPDTDGADAPFEEANDDQSPAGLEPHDANGAPSPAPAAAPEAAATEPDPIPASDHPDGELPAIEQPESELRPPNPADSPIPPSGTGLGAALASLRGTAGRLFERRRRDDPWEIDEIAPDGPQTDPIATDPTAPSPEEAPVEPPAAVIAEAAPDEPDADVVETSSDENDVDDETPPPPAPPSEPPADQPAASAAQLSLDDAGADNDGDETPGTRVQEYRFAAADGPWPVNPFSSRATPVLDTAGQVDASQITRPLFTLTGSIPSFRRRTAARDPNADDKTGPGWGPILLGLGALLIALAAVAGALLIPELVSDSERNEFDRFVEQARDGLTAATLSADPAGTRFELQRATSASESALALRPLDPDALVLQQEIETALRQVNAIVQPPGLQVLRAFGGQAALSAIEIGGGVAYTLDEAGSTVVAFDFATGISRTVFAAGEQYLLIGEFAGLTAAAPIGIEWTSTSRDASLSVLDETGQLFRVTTASGTEAYFLENPEVIGSARAVTANEAGLYLLDSSGVIWLFPFQADGSLGAASAAIDRTDLAQATDLTIVDDDNVGATFLVTSGDGRVRRFNDGQDQGFPLDLDRPLLVPASLSIGELSDLVYLADRGNNRVLVLTPAGETVAQLRAPQLEGVRGVYVDELNQRLYFVTASDLLASGLPDQLAR